MIFGTFQPRQGDDLRDNLHFILLWYLGDTIRQNVPADFFLNGRSQSPLDLNFHKLKCSGHRATFHEASSLWAFSTVHRLKKAKEGGYL